MSIEAPKLCYICIKPLEFMFCTISNKSEKIQICSNRCFMRHKFDLDRIQRFNDSVLQHPGLAKIYTIGSAKKDKTITKVDQKKLDCLGEKK